MLISAVASARGLNYVNDKLDWSGRDAFGVKSELVWTPWRFLGDVGPSGAERRQVR